jgi:hypothetical protein
LVNERSSRVACYFKKIPTERIAINRRGDIIGPFLYLSIIDKLVGKHAALCYGLFIHE